MKKVLLTSLVLLIAFPCICFSQRAKMSPYVREASRQAKLSAAHGGALYANDQRTPTKLATRPTLTAFVKVTEAKELIACGCEILAQWDDLFIASIPLDSLEPLAAKKAVSRIEACRPMSIANDTCAQLLGTNRVWNGEQLPLAFTGEGVVVGIQDIGFDFTHPTFAGRIQAFWDMLSPDTMGSNMPVGRDYIGWQSIHALGHSFDGQQEAHGTHTAGSAAGSGYQGHYQGMAPESELVMIANATGNNVNLIDSADLYKYTNATDVLGFKYAFDYAESQGKPCVISFSEGADDDLYESDLFFEALENITGPGKILVASAGNKGLNKSYLPKPKGDECATAKMIAREGQMLYFVRTDRPIDNTLLIDDISYSIDTELVANCEDSIFTDTIVTSKAAYELFVALYPSCWNDRQLVYEIFVSSEAPNFEVTFEMVGEDAFAEAFSYMGTLRGDETRYDYSIQIPSAAPAVISVGAVGYRDFVINYKGQRKVYQHETGGCRSNYSSIGPSLKGDTKPDIMAPGNNVISSYNSFYLEQNSTASDVDWDTERFNYEGRTYSWTSNSGTSMSSPIAAGIIALWLQANPQLTKDDLLDVFAHTARHYDDTLTYPNSHYGYGEINAYEGLLYILGFSGIVSPNLLSEDIFPLKEGEVAEFYSTDGRKLYTLTYADSQTVILCSDAKPFQFSQSPQLSHLPQGIYAVQIISPTPSRCGSSLFRR